jgi:hypothetical protein
MTLPDVLLAAALDLPSIFTAEDLTVAAWRRCPERLSLEGYPAYPDHHRVYAMLCGKDGLVRKDFMERLVDGGLMLSEQGRQRILQVSKANGKPLRV